MTIKLFSMFPALIAHKPSLPHGHAVTVFTIGHGNRAIGEFLTLLRNHAIEILVDVRAHPVSRRPAFCAICA
jgi:hypothetical protein